MPSHPVIKVLGISGSLRNGSYNSALLQAALELLPDGMTIEIFDLHRLPFFTQDSENPFPPEVVDFREKVREAAALLIATPEYNSSVSATLKNALDWASRGADQPLKDKPVAIIGASTGNFGTVRSQLQLRQILTHIGALPLGKPEVLVARAEKVFDSEGRLVDNTVRGFLRDLLTALMLWTNKVISK
jgi:chromate reductase